MSKDAGRNITGLLKHAAALKSDTEKKVNEAIDALKRSKTKKVNFRTVSELSGVSTTTLYNNPILRERIASLRAVKRLAQDDSVTNMSVRNREIELRLRQEVQKLKEEKHMLIVQLVDLERLKTENQQLKSLLSQRQLE